MVAVTIAEIGLRVEAADGPSPSARNAGAAFRGLARTVPRGE
ncbi:hypothetical protein I550_0930 [Mycobacterium intracellulare 1956]|uniref:Uncharacterized protein n=1 Tax=Mycobacterium intracellulare 1956 TaxID=1299331 RepID=X8CQT5_MYCIT|nr:hypothetical protein I550_0930 [Mycobacterium intracellulare 1956]